MERLQIRTVGADRQRHMVTCNGHPVPMLATDTAPHPLRVISQEHFASVEPQRDRKPPIA